MTNIRLVASDIDGTLTNEQRELTPYTVQILQALLKRDIPVVLVSGRNPWATQPYLQQIGEPARAICQNGIFLLENGEIHAGNFITTELARQAVALLLGHDCVPLVYGEDRITRYLPTPTGMTEVAKLLSERTQQPYAQVNSTEELFEVHPAQISVCETPERGAELYPHLEQAFGDQAYIIYQPGKRTWVEVNHLQARKDNALLSLARRLDISADEILYFGDNLNDRVVFEKVPHSVAMSNARREIKDLAWREAASNTEDGVARFLAAHFGILGDLT